MKVKRQDSSETNKTTAFWLYEFAHDLDKKAGDVDYLRDYLSKNYKNKKFSTIEEKLADIKARVGFDLARKVTNEIEKKSAKEESSCGCKKPCGCGKDCKCDGDCGCKNKASDQVKTASKKNKKSKSKKNIKIMENILNYIRQMIHHEPHLDPLTILNRCRSADELKFNNIQHIIDHEKLNSYINELISDMGVSDDVSAVVYVPINNDDLIHSDVVAEYYNHAEPTRS